MYGPGAAPPPPPRTDGTVLALRVLLVVLAVLSCGILASVPLFRVAFLRRRVLDWVLAAVAVPVTFGLFAVVGTLAESDPRTDVALLLLLAIAAGSSVYFLVYDIRHRPARPMPQPYPPTAPTIPSTPHAPHTPYGYPPVPQQPQPQPQPTLGTSPVPQPPAEPVPPHRIDQVRAELDELSDYLRRQDGGSPGGGAPGGGR
jgi:hypothetical protein